MVEQGHRPEDLSGSADVVSVKIGPTSSGHVPALGASGAAAVGFELVADEATIPLPKALSVLIEGYLLGDLESMATEIKPKEIGAVGYPMVMAVLSGSELLGALGSDVAQTNRIEWYWEHFLAQVDPRYAHLGKVASDLARNGIAHSYLTHVGVLVVRGGTCRHLSLAADEVVFECLQLYLDFRRTSSTHVPSYSSTRRMLSEGLTTWSGTTGKKHKVSSRRSQESYSRRRWVVTGRYRLVRDCWQRPPT